MSESKNLHEIGKKEESGILPALVSALKNDLGPALEEIEVKDVRIGLAYTGVLLSENYGGVACTPLYEFSCCPALGFAGFLKGKTADKLLELSLSKKIPLKQPLELQQQMHFPICSVIWSLKASQFQMQTSLTL
ncbi:enolase N-terminal-like fold-containing protein [Methanosarcina horonobensis]|uniref:enolase N-terminal-like fold-containing protein n=1 Tax=Methanosarcina horonobensis TaxID=418008 RepID=UPI000A6A8CEC|nr:DUF4213 domain-containing proteins [Methanosarcina horonobensis]